MLQSLTTFPTSSPQKSTFRLSFANTAAPSLTYYSMVQSIFAGTFSLTMLLKHILTIPRFSSSGKMPIAVREALVDVLRDEGNTQQESAEDVMKAMEKSGRYLQETW